MPKFEVKRYYTTYFTQEVEAENEAAAWKESKGWDKIPEAMEELKDNLSLWSDADEIEEL